MMRGGQTPEHVHGFNEQSFPLPINDPVHRSPGKEVLFLIGVRSIAAHNPVPGPHDDDMMPKVLNLSRK